MKGRPVDQLVYECMFPKPKTGDPQSFQAFLQRSLVPEVRHETQAFYGHLTSQEAKYPGLDYSYRPHRVRLSRFPWHRRLFRAFDNLRLTEYEIATLTKWEGTRWAKERFEKEKGIIIRDTTGDGIEDWVSPELRPTVVRSAVPAEEEELEEEEEDLDDNDLEDDDADSDIEITSVGTALNERLIAAAAEREAGNFMAPMDEAWEQWMKEAYETVGVDMSNSNSNVNSNPDLNPNANIVGTRPAPNGSRVYVAHPSAQPASHASHAGTTNLTPFFDSSNGRQIPSRYIDIGRIDSSNMSFSRMHAEGDSSREPIEQTIMRRRDFEQAVMRRADASREHRYLYATRHPDVLRSIHGNRHVPEHEDYSS
ncbi:uncharacterized protein EAF01_002158 [Botrytis porri]|uniref:Uncharacterized protein n=1 Tax=Botrytis porri TaxID=87229 RepID=A0A4Z1KFZ9_9HELO|nr:uncharacterized protein EAF01_002158 [Botrytis porri]KAF7910648.1 hypothetical protein EAF01_002158 [Botrytis porri]TGO84967.1 hypothetical protein BPOR_0446g00100 [Botrytis porri]